MSSRPGNSQPTDSHAGADMARISSLSAENHELRAELEQLRAERNRLAETQRRIMELLHVQSPDKLVHDLRNILNERELLRALVRE